MTVTGWLVPGWQRALERARTRFPKVRVVYLDESRTFRALAWLVRIFNPDFLVDGAFTLGDAIVVPSRAWLLADEQRATVTMVHELVHVADYHAVGALKWGWRYAHADGRLAIECRAYAASYLYCRAVGRDFNRNWVAEQLAGTMYAHAARSPAAALSTLATAILTAQFSMQPCYRDVREIFGGAA